MGLNHNLLTVSVYRQISSVVQESLQDAGQFPARTIYSTDHLSLISYQSAGLIISWILSSDQ